MISLGAAFHEVRGILIAMFLIFAQLLAKPKLGVEKNENKIGLKAIAAMPPNSILWDVDVHGFNARRQFSDVVTSASFIERWTGLALAAHRSPRRLDAGSGP